MVMTEDAVDKKPVPRKQSAPEFPAKARQRGIQGFVKLNLFINGEGSVEKVRVLEAEPQGVFEESAIAAAQAWEFEPAEYNGNPVTGWFKRTVSFRLN
jgi:protein TonB